MIELLSLNPQTGQGTLVATNSGFNDVIAAMDFHPLTGELFGIEFRFVSDPTSLVTIDTSNALFTRIGELPVCSDALVFIIIPRPIPTLSQWGLIAMATILGIVGFMVMRRRKVTA